MRKIKDNRDPQVLGEALLKARQQMPHLTIPQIIELHETLNTNTNTNTNTRIGGIEAGSISTSTNGHVDIGPKGEGADQDGENA